MKVLKQKAAEELKVPALCQVFLAAFQKPFVFLKTEELFVAYFGIYGYWN